MTTSFDRWLDTFIDEKGIDLEEIFEVEGPSGPNHMPYGVVIEAIHSAPRDEQDRIKTLIVKLDFQNGDVRHLLRHLAQAIAI
jgi:hypothetical protein